MGELGISTSLNGSPLDSGAAANPCGLVAKSIFNDTFKLYLGGGVTDQQVITTPALSININSTGIAWDSDKEYKFKNM